MSDISRISEALERAREDIHRLEALLHLRRDEENGGNAPPEIQAKLESVGFTQYDHDIWQVEHEGNIFLVRVKTYPMFPRNPSRREIEDILLAAGWEHFPPGQWRRNDADPGLKLREAYDSYRSTR